MNIKEFVGYYKMSKDKKAECEKHIKESKYVPYLTKIAECDNIVKVTMENQSSGSYVQNTPGRYLYFNMKLVSIYTDIEMPMENGLQLTENYDLLNECGALDILIDCIPKHEFKEFSTLLSMCVDDYMANNRDFTSYIDKKWESLMQLALNNIDTEKELNQED